MAKRRAIGDLKKGEVKYEDNIPAQIKDTSTPEEIKQRKYFSRISYNKGSTKW